MRKRFGAIRLAVCLCTLLSGTLGRAIFADTVIPAGSLPFSVAVNPVTNKIYVANNLSNTVTEIDGQTYVTTPINVGSAPTCIAVAPATNKIYVTNSGGSLTSID